MVARESVRHVASIRETDDAHLVRVDSEVRRDLQNQVSEEERVELIVVNAGLKATTPAAQRKAFEVPW